MQVQLPTGNTITISVYEYFFILKDEDMAEFYQSCIADDLGTYVDNPFSNSSTGRRIEVEEDENNM